MQRQEYDALPQARLGGVECDVADAQGWRLVRPDSPAVEVMTDLRQIPAATIPADLCLAEANRAMILRGVRLLFVAERPGPVEGLITAADLLGERPVRVARQRGVAVDELVVANVMTPIDQIEAVALEDVMRADVGHIIATLRRSGRQHTLVIEHRGGGRRVIRGIFSSTQIARQLGKPLPASTEIARNFAEIEAAIAF